MGVRRSTPSSARQRYYQRRVKRMGALLTVALFLAVAVCSSLAYPVLAPNTKQEISVAQAPTPTPTTILIETLEETDLPEVVATQEIEQRPMAMVAIPILIPRACNGPKKTFGNG